MRAMTIGLTAAAAVTVALLLLPAFTPRAALACVVGASTGASCIESALNGCLPGGGSFDGTVTFNCGSSPVTITITSTKTISADTTIDGGSLITISGGNSVGVFSVNTGVKFTVQNLTISSGSNIAPFAIGGVGGAISNGTTRGGGGTLTVSNSTFSGNSATIGGAIYNAGTLTVSNSTFSGNSATHAWGLTPAQCVKIGDCGGGAIANGYYGTVTNSTFSDNTAGIAGAIINGVGASRAGTLTVSNSTFSGNSAMEGGAIINGVGTLALTDSIVAASSEVNCSGVITDGGHNLDDGTTCGFTGTGCTSTTGTSFCNTNPVLDPAGLQNNGGPTKTIALQAGSPAINAGDEAVCAAAPVNNVDQRGYVRPGVGSTNCSIGAYEFESPGPPSGCVGDCHNDGHVTVDEILTMVNVALGNADISTCTAGDANDDGTITVDEILAAVNNALNGGLNVTGNWDIEFSLPGGCQPGWVCNCTLSLSQDAGLVNGTLVCGGPSTISGAVCGNSISLTFLNCVAGNCYWVHLTGIVTPTHMSGTGSPEGTWSATKHIALQ